MTLNIETDRLFIRPWNDTDASKYQTLSKDVGYNVFSSPGHFSVRNDTEALEKLKLRMTLFQERGLGKFPVFLKATDEIIGTCGLEPYLIEGKSEVELGYRLCLAHWGKGYATEAAKAILQYGFSDLKLEKIVAFAVPQNSQSLKIIEKLGFRYLKTFEHAGLPHRLSEMSAFSLSDAYHIILTDLDGTIKGQDLAMTSVTEPS